MKNRMPIMLLTVLMFLTGLAKISFAQEAPSKPLDPGWFMDQEDEVFWQKADKAYNTGRYGEAIVAYLEVLRQDKGNQDAAIIWPAVTD